MQFLSFLLVLFSFPFFVYGNDCLDSFDPSKEQRITKELMDKALDDELVFEIMEKRVETAQDLDSTEISLIAEKIDHEMPWIRMWSLGLLWDIAQAQTLEPDIVTKLRQRLKDEHSSHIIEIVQSVLKQVKRKSNS